uniref:Ig-like domain-containing protein n=1 Tax=Sphenodon punctatus TaxID=8508 RepID=A0A8D0GCY8_SPHPU
MESGGCSPRMNLRVGVGCGWGRGTGSNAQQSRKMTPALPLLFLGCWLAGPSWVLGQYRYPKPSISVSPGAVIGQGETLTVYCLCNCRGAEFLLFRNGNLIQQMNKYEYGGELSFPNMRPEHTGSYTCRYRYNMHPQYYPDPSDPVQVTLAERLPKPNISIAPHWWVRLGLDVTIRCQAPAQHRGLQFSFYKDGTWWLNRMTPAGRPAEIHMGSISREHSGVYTCRSVAVTAPYLWSDPSDPVELLVSDPSLPKPHIRLSPTGVIAPGGSVCVSCLYDGSVRGFYLSTSGDRTRPPSLQGAWHPGEFPLSNVSRERAGSYSCSIAGEQSRFLLSEPSDPTELWVSDPSLPRPSISLSPSGVIAEGANVTVRCQAPRSDALFFLYKPGGLSYRSPTRGVSQFLISSVTGPDAGSYHCSYHLNSTAYVSSEPSDPGELLIASEGETEHPVFAPTVPVTPPPTFL